ncbi:DeoR/GlpR family DNA-binding transcription regulator [Nocardiopsis sp. RV163]|uniref:DeoR/GlpR family DNA-binding transcription regulator n=1 Tax=Nocardiopsis sp. RV163 TaxID=1661388 RepID=UPI00064C28AF|nr:DeoR family transcriptional regulator [Nocardiopsis sp. RV163]
MSGLSGGATAVRHPARASATTTPSGSGRLSAAEGRIARAALAELPYDGVIMLDAGLMAERIAWLLPAGCGLNVLTNSVPAALGLASRRDLSVHLLGGRVSASAGTTLSSARMMEQLHVDVTFMVADGVSPERGLTCADPAEVTTRQAMVRASSRVVLLADHTRISCDRIARFARLREMDCLITDTGTDPEDVRRLRGRGPRVLVV